MYRYPAARLWGGAKQFGTRAEGTFRGEAELVSRVASFTAPIEKLLLAKQLGKSRHQAWGVRPVQRSTGGVARPETIVLYGWSGVVLASAYLGKFEKQEHASVTAVTLRSDHL